MRTQDRAFRFIEKLALMFGLAVLVVLAGLLVLNALSAQMNRSHGILTACESNLRNISTALEMYSVDHGGTYPHGVERLTPNYLRVIPTCPAAEADSYSATYKTFNNPAVACGDHASQETDSGKCQRHKLALEQLMPTDYNYRFCCGGANHEDVDISADYPAYDSISGLQEHP